MTALNPHDKEEIANSLVQTLLILGEM